MCDSSPPAEKEGRANRPRPGVPRPRQLFAQPLGLFVLVADPFVTLAVIIVVGGTRAFIGHARVMADSRQKYKHEIVITPSSPAKWRAFFYVEVEEILVCFGHIRKRNADTGLLRFTRQRTRPHDFAF